MTHQPLIPLNDLSRSWIASDPAVERAVSEVLRGGWYIHGPQHEYFENELAEFIGTAGAVGVNSGTDALTLALAALGAERGSVIGTAANAGGYASVAAQALGCKVQIVDVNPATGVIGVDEAANSDHGDLQFLVLTHLYGNVADAEILRAWCDSNAILLVEDCAQAIGGRVGEARVGSFGHAACFSFYPTKNLGGAGDGGAITSQDPNVLERARRLRNYGWGKRYVIDDPHGRNSRLDELQAAILRIGLGRVDSLNAARRGIVARYAESLEESTNLRMLTQASPECTAHLAVVASRTRAAQRRLHSKLRDHGVSFSEHYPIPDHQQPGLSHIAPVADLPGTEVLSGSVTTIPAFPEMSAEEIGRVADAVRDAG